MREGGRFSNMQGKGGDGSAVADSSAKKRNAANHRGAAGGEHSSERGKSKEQRI